MSGGGVRGMARIGPSLHEWGKAHRWVILAESIATRSLGLAGAGVGCSAGLDVVDADIREEDPLAMASNDFDHVRISKAAENLTGATGLGTLGGEVVGQQCHSRSNRQTLRHVVTVNSRRGAKDV